MQRSAAIVATLGPASWDLAPALCAAGANAIRLNASHMSAGGLALRAAALRRELPGTPLVIDLQGAKMRLGEFSERAVRRDERIRFALTGEGETIPLPHPEIFGAVAPGETLSCDDDRLRFRVEAARPGMIRAVALAGGILRSRKGVNLVEHPVILQDVSEFDLACIQEAAAAGAATFAFSFMRDGSEASWVRRHAPGCGIIGKIERSEAMAGFAAISSAVDSVWICRGDLGAQVGPAAMAQWVAGIHPRAHPCPVFMAGHVMEHLTAHAGPTRAEVCHLYDLKERGYAGFVLSDETATGADPVRAVSTLRALLDSFERL